MKSVISELLFWVHVSISLSVPFLGFFLPIEFLLLFFLAWRLHIYVLHGCVITVLQHRIGGIPKDTSFTQFAARRFLHKDITRKHIKLFEYSAGSFSILLSFLIHGSYFFNQF